MEMAGLTPSLRELKADLADHRRHCEAKKRRCPYEEKVERQIKKEERRDREDELSPEAEYMNAVRGERANGGKYDFAAIGQTVQLAARSFNAHADRGDFSPNMSKMGLLPKAMSELTSAMMDPSVSPQDKAYAADLMGAVTHMATAVGKGAQYRKVGIVKSYSPSTAAGSKSAGSAPAVGTSAPAPAAGKAGKAAGVGTQAPSAPIGGILSGIIGAAGNGGGSAQAPKPSTSQAPSSAAHRTSGIIPFCDGPSPYETYLKRVNSCCQAATDPNDWKDMADILDDKTAIDMLEDWTKFGNTTAIVKGGYHDSFDANDPDEPELWSGWNPSKKLSGDTLRCAAICFKDLSERFPRIPWKDNLELRCGTKSGTAGQSTHTSDHRRHTILFNCDYGHVWPGVGLGNGASNYGHSDNRLPFDVLRHELGHALISGVLPNGKKMISKWHDAMTKAYGNPATALFDFARTHVSEYAAAEKGFRGVPSMAECLSECFSLATSPDYKPGYLPRPVEDFIFEQMLGVKAGSR